MQFPSPFGVMEFELAVLTVDYDLPLMFPSPFGVMEFEPRAGWPHCR